MPSQTVPLHRPPFAVELCAERGSGLQFQPVGRVIFRHFEQLEQKAVNRLPIRPIGRMRHVLHHQNRDLIIRAVHRLARNIAFRVKFHANRAGDVRVIAQITFDFPRDFAPVRRPFSADDLRGFRGLVRQWIVNRQRPAFHGRRDGLHEFQQFAVIFDLREFRRIRNHNPIRRDIGVAFVIDPEFQLGLRRGRERQFEQRIIARQRELFARQFLLRQNLFIERIIDIEREDFRVVERIVVNQYAEIGV